MLQLASIAFNRPRLIHEQIRLLERYLLDPFELIVFDNSTQQSRLIEDICDGNEVRYVRLPRQAHHEALNSAAATLDAPFIGFLDHDVFPIRETRLIPLIEEAGFYGIGQRHPATGRLYLWPGFCFFGREWLHGRPLDFSGLRDGDKRNDGDTGSSLWTLFENENWEKMYSVPHGYKPIRKPDSYGLQSWGYEFFGDWLHFSNGSGWMKVPDPDERERLLFEALPQ